MVRQRSSIRTSSTNGAEHIELKQNLKSLSEHSTNVNHLTALENLFGAPREELHRWPGATAYCKFLESCFKPLLATDYDAIWVLIGEPKPEEPDGCWPWFTAVCSAIHKLHEDNSIEDVWNGLNLSPEATSQHSLGRIELNSSPGKAACLVAIFAVLCWASMTLQPKIIWEDFKGQPDLAIQYRKTNFQSLKMDIVRRPIPAIFRAFQRFLPSGRWQQPIGNTSDKISHENSVALYISTLNYSTLKTIGKIRLEWVDNLASHLDFDPGNRTLFVFRFPTFCLLSTLKEKHCSVLEGLTRGLYKTDNEASNELEMTVRISQEVLMSYRVLFGQTRSSRIIAKSVLRRLRDHEPHYDELLEDLCTRPCDSKIAALPPSLWPISCRSFDNTLQEEDSYSSQDDFPVYGQRLAKLQEFSLRQQPSRLRDLWRDRRIPLQWYTFWVVLIVGSLSILLALLQLGVGIAQLVASLKQGSCQC